MNCFLYSRRIFEACRLIDKSSRGEYERLPMQCADGGEHGEHFDVVPVEWSSHVETAATLLPVVEALSSREVKLHTLGSLRDG